MRTSSCVKSVTAMLFLVALAVLPAPAAAQRRTLQQGDALSNSNGCIGQIPKCESGACVTRDIMGVARWACLRCLANYEPVIDGSGQDNIIQCVCPKGFFEDSTSATSCTRCPVNSFCPGGDKVENPSSRGAPWSCGTGMVTRNTGARSQADCVAPAGFAQTSPNMATACARSEYAPMYNRLAKCLRCQSGLAEAPNSGLTDSQRSNKKTVCKVPPGKYMSQGLVRICPQGFYRENYVDYDADVAQICLPCNPGITTEGPGAGFQYLCNKVVPGFGIAVVYNVSATGKGVPALPVSNSTGLPNATLCDFGFYSQGGYCAQCPNNTVTRNKGAKAVEECMVPPGYLIAGTLTPCATGQFREGWVIYSDDRASHCTPCGDNIGSEARDLDENPLVANGTLVRASSTCCFINAGQGMIPRGFNIYVGMDCLQNTYGAAGKVYGWAAAPCKPCPRNMITDGLMNVNNSDVCINPDGFGYASEGAGRCAPGFYSWKGSRRPCMGCPYGRTTADDPSGQRYLTDCVVKPGMGVVNATANATDPYTFNTFNTSADDLVKLNVLDCPVGYYGTGGGVGSQCTKCPCGSSTEGTGASSADGCSVCAPGFGKPTPTSACAPCPFGSYQPGGFSTCTGCPSTSFYTPVDGNGPIVTINGTSLFNGAYGTEACVPWISQLSPEAGQAYFSPENTAVLSLLNTTNKASMGACFAACPSDMCCMTQYDFNGGNCSMATFTPIVFGTNVTSGMVLMYKLPPAGLAASASKVHAKTLASGYYATCSIPAATAATWQTAGTNLGPDARTFARGAPVWDTASGSSKACQRRCDESNVCWGFVFDAASRACLYRGGVDTMRTRSFFTVPFTGMQSNSTAECPAQSAGLQLLGGALSIVDLSCPTPCGAGQMCINGVCGCTNPGLTVCNGVCVNTTNSTTHCGACNAACTPQQCCFNGICAEQQVACGSAMTFSGNEGNFTYSITIGTKGSTFNFDYNGYSYPDRFNVYLPNGTRIFTKMAGQPGKPSPSCYCPLCKVNNEETFANSNVNLTRPFGVSAIKVVVNGYCPGTMWQFTVGCAV